MAKYVHGRASEVILENTDAIDEMRRHGESETTIAKKLGVSRKLLRLRHPRSATQVSSFKLDYTPGEAQEEAGEVADLKARVSYLQGQQRTSQNYIQTLQKTIGGQLEISNAIRESIVAEEPYPKVWKAPAIRKDKPLVVPVLLWSDWHIGEIIDPRQTEGFGEYNWKIAQDRFFGIIDDQLRWIEANRTQYRIDTCQVLSLGDYVSGGIHKELEVYPEFDVPVQAVKAGHLGAEGLLRLASHFEKVDVEYVTGNHDRLWMKPQHKNSMTNAWSFVVHSIARAYVQNETAISFPNPEENIGSKKTLTINTHKFLIEHGENFKAWMGIPYYGIERGLGKEARKRMKLLDESTYFHWHAIGHWHMPSLVSNTTFINGSLSGTTEHDHNNNRFSEPAQVAFMLSKNHVFNITPFGGIA